MGARSFASFDGTRISYEIYGEGVGRPVVLHHGFGADRRINWLGPGIVQALVATGHKVVALDARSHGQSDKPREVARCGEANMTRDLSRLYDEIGADEVDLVGYSMGAVVALLNAASDTRVQRLIVGGVGEGVLVCGGVDRRHLPPDELRSGMLVSDPDAIAHPEIASFRSFVDAMGIDRHALAAHCRAVHASPIALDRISVPTWVLAGTEDPLAVHPERLAAAIPGARCVTFPGDHTSAIVAPEFKRTLLDALT